MTVNADRLKPFAGHDYPQPWDTAGHAYATDRVILARVPSDLAMPLPPTGRIPPTAAVEIWFSALFPLTGQFVTLPPVPPTPPPCETCTGRDRWECPECDGDGTVSYSARYGRDIDDIECPLCDGDGVIDSADAAAARWKPVGEPTPCGDCGGLKTQAADEPAVAVGGGLYAMKYLRIVAALPGVRVTAKGVVLAFESGDLQGVVQGVHAEGAK